MFGNIQEKTKRITVEDYNQPSTNSQTQVLELKCENFSNLKYFLRDTLDEFPNLFLIDLHATDNSRNADDYIKLFYEKDREFLIKINLGDELPELYQREKKIIPENEIRTSSIHQISFKEISLFIYDILITERHSPLNTDLRLQILQKLGNLGNENCNKILLSNSLAANDLFFFRFILCFFYHEVTEELISQTLHISKSLKFYKVLVKIGHEFDTNFLFDTCVDKGNYEALEYFVKNKEKEISQEDWENLIIKSDKKEFYHIFDLLKETKIINCNRSVKSIFLKKISQGHKIVRDIHCHIREDLFHVFVKWFNEARESLEHKTLCKQYCGYLKMSLSAIDYSIHLKKFEIYAFLRSEGMITDSPKDLREKIDNLTEEEKYIIFKENMSYAKPDILNQFLSLCNVDCCSSVLQLDHIRNILEPFKNNDLCWPLIKIISKSNGLYLFDFMYEFASDLYPSIGYKNFATGVTLPLSQIIIIGNDFDKKDLCGTIFHESTHLVCALIYENDALPFCKDDIEKENDWNQIFDSIKNHPDRDSEEIMRWLFEGPYKDDDLKPELAVRVPHMLSRYKDDPKKIQGLRKLFSKLFDFYEKIFIPDLNIPNVLEVIQFNNSSKLFARIENSKFQPIEEKFSNFLSSHRLIINSSLPFLTLKKIFREIDEKEVEGRKNKLNKKAKNIFIDLSENVSEQLIEFLKLKISIRVIIKADQIEDLESLNFIKELKNDIIIVVSVQTQPLASLPSEFKKFNDSLTWGDLSEKSKEKFLDTKVNEIKMRKLNMDEFLSNESLIFLDFDDSFTLENSEPKIIPNFVERYFIDGNIKMPTQREINDYRFKKDHMHIFKASLPNPPPSENDENSPKFGISSEEFAENLELITLLVDIAGSGKTTILKKIYNTLCERNQDSLIFFVPLRKVQGECESEGFFEFIQHLLKLNDVQMDLFKYKYERNEVKILFDGYDEVSESFRVKLLKLFEQHKEKGKSNFFITTRPTQEERLKNVLNVKSWKLRILIQQEQYKYLRNSWKSRRLDQKLIDNCAWTLVLKIADFFYNYPYFMGVFIPLQYLADDLKNKNKIKINFASEISDLNMFEIFEGIIKNMINRKNNENLDVIFQLTIGPLQQLSINKCSGVNFFPNVHYTDIKHLVKSGAFFIDDDSVIVFAHETIPEFLVARYFIQCFTDSRANLLEQDVQKTLELFLDLLNKDKFEIVLVFLNDSLGQKTIPNRNEFLKTFGEALIEIIQNESINFMMKIQKFSNICVFILWLIKEQEHGLYRSLITANKDFLLLAITGVKNFEVFQKFFDEIFAIMNPFIVYFIDKPKNQAPFLSVITRDEVSIDNFNYIWKKIEEKFDKSQIERCYKFKTIDITPKEEVQTLKLSFVKAETRSNFLLYCTNNCENIKKITAVFQKAYDFYLSEKSEDTKEKRNWERFNEAVLEPSKPFNCFAAAYFRHRHGIFLCIFEFFVKKTDAKKLKEYFGDTINMWVAMSMRSVIRDDLEEEIKVLKKIWKNFRVNKVKNKEIYEIFFKSDLSFFNAMLTRIGEPSI